MQSFAWAGLELRCVACSCHCRCLADEASGVARGLYRPFFPRSPKFITAQEASSCKKPAFKSCLRILASASRTGGFSSEWNVDGGLPLESATRKARLESMILLAGAQLELGCRSRATCGKEESIIER